MKFGYVFAKLISDTASSDMTNPDYVLANYILEDSIFPPTQQAAGPWSESGT
jgi:hypothetical protein